ncbi:hypothetical protein [Gilvimarinus agarilyticus]|uniref:hypothetical protein n=1 Tax=Gilvimarinus agarilyticus TaxID=679259 RepID=UPI0012FA0E8E|nr:hypothetical protein [Gilvimarinus agarilyticus]
MDNRQTYLPEQLLDDSLELLADLPAKPTRPMVNRTLLTAAAIVSALLHLVALYHWPAPRTTTLSITEPHSTLHLTLRRPAPTAKTATAANHITPVKTPEPDITPSGKSQAPAKPSQPKTTLNTVIKKTPVNTTTPAPPASGAMVKKVDNPAIFNPRLQQKVNAAKAKRLQRHSTRKNNDSWQSAHNTTVIELDYGGCLKAQQRKSRGVTQDWYMSGCNGKQDAGEKILNNMQQALDKR